MRYAFAAFIGLSCTLLNYAEARADKLKQIKVSFRTHDDDKDRDTHLDVTVFIGDEQCADGKDLGFNTTFGDRPPSVHEFELRNLKPNLRRKDIQRIRTNIAIQANGNDHWIFDLELRFYFDENPNNPIVLFHRGCEMESRSSQRVEHNYFPR